MYSSLCMYVYICVYIYTCMFIYTLAGQTQLHLASHFVAAASLNHFHTSLNVLAKIRRNWQVNFIDSALEVAKTRFQTFLWAKVCYSNGNVRFENFMHMEWSEEKFRVLKGIVGDKRRLRFWNKHQKIVLLFTQLAHYNRMHERVLNYQKTISEKLANK